MQHCGEEPKCHSYREAENMQVLGAGSTSYTIHHIASYLTRSMPSKASSSPTGSRLHTPSLPMQTPCSLAPISAPHSQAGRLRITACVFSTWSTSIYVHCGERHQNSRGLILALSPSLIYHNMKVKVPLERMKLQTSLRSRKPHKCHKICHKELC